MKKHINGIRKSKQIGIRSISTYPVCTMEILQLIRIIIYITGLKIRTQAHIKRKNHPYEKPFGNLFQVGRQTIQKCISAQSSFVFYR